MKTHPTERSGPRLKQRDEQNMRLRWLVANLAALA